MITSLQLVDFKNFADETLRAGPFTVIVGTNASGKSNIRDAFRILHGIGRGYTLAEIIGGKYDAGTQTEWAWIRGAPSEVIRFGQPGFCLKVELTLGESKIVYSIRVEHDGSDQDGFRVAEEKLKFGRDDVYASHAGAPISLSVQSDPAYLFLRMETTGQQSESGYRVTTRRNQPALTQIWEHKDVSQNHKDRVQLVIDAFAAMRFLDPLPDLMREPAFPGQTVLGDGGENLPTVLQEICKNPKRAAVLYEWVRELTPMDVEKFSFPHGPLTELVELKIGEKNGRMVSADSASDGTLRFLAMLAALLGEHSAPPDREVTPLYFFEELDNGIHSSRLSLLLDLVEGQTAKGGLQVITTTHSSSLLAMISDDTFQNTSVVSRLPDTDDAVIRPVCDLHRSKELRQSQGLGRLHASGWMEDMLVFTAEAGEPGK